MNSNGQDAYAIGLSDDVLIQLADDLFRRGNAREQRLSRAAASLLLLEDRLTQINTLAADVNVARSFDQRANIAVTLATERTEGILLRGARPTTASCQILTCGHDHSLGFR